MSKYDEVEVAFRNAHAVASNEELSPEQRETAKKHAGELAGYLREMSQESQTLPPTAEMSPKQAVDYTPTDTSEQGRRAFEHRPDRGAFISTSDLARSKGIEVDKVPYQISKGYGMLPEGGGGIDGYTKLQGAKAVADKYFSDLYGEPTSVEVVSEDESGIGLQLFKHPRTGQLVAFDSLGIDNADIKREAERILAPAALGGAAGAVATAIPQAKGMGVVGALGKVAQGTLNLVKSPTFAGGAVDIAGSVDVRRRELNSLKEEGILPDEFDTSGELTMEGIASTLGNVAGAVGVKYIGRQFAGDQTRLVAKNLGVDVDLMEDMLARYMAEEGKIAEERGIHITAADMLTAVAKTPEEKVLAEKVTSTLDDLKYRKHHEHEFRAKEIENQQRVKAMFSDTLDEMPGTDRVVSATELDQYVISNDAVTASADRVTKYMDDKGVEFDKQFQEPVKRALADAKAAADDLVAQADDPRVAISKLHNAEVRAEELFDQGMAVAYQDIERRAGPELIFDPSKIRSHVTDVNKRHDKELASAEATLGDTGVAKASQPTPFVRGKAGAAEAEEAAATEASERKEALVLLLKASGLKQPAINALTGMDEDLSRGAVPRNVSFSELRQVLKNLRKSAYEVQPQNKYAKQEANLLKDVVERELHEQSEQLLGKEFSDDLINLDSAWSVGYDVLKENLRKNMLKNFKKGRTQPSGEARPPFFYSTAFRDTFEGRAGADTYIDIMDMRKVKFVDGDADVQNNLDGVEIAIKRGLWEEFNHPKRGAMVEKDGVMIVDEARLNNFLERYDDLLTAGDLFSDVDKVKMRHAAGLQDTLRQVEKQQDELQKRLSKNKFPWGESALNGNSSKLFKQTWGVDHHSANKELYNVLQGTGNMDLIKDYRMLIARDMFDHNTHGIFSNGMVDPAKLTRYLKNNREALTTWFSDPQAPQAGSRFLDALENINSMAKQTMRARAPASPAERDILLSAVNDVARGIVGIFSRTGRAMTAGIKLNNLASTNELVHFLLDPKTSMKGERFMRDWMDSQGSKALQRQADDVTMLYLGDEDENAARREIRKRYDKPGSPYILGGSDK